MKQDNKLPLAYYFFLRDGVVIEIGAHRGGEEALEYCKKRYGKTAVVALTVGGQDAKVEYQHVYKRGMTNAEAESDPAKQSATH